MLFAALVLASASAAVSAPASPPHIHLEIAFDECSALPGVVGSMAVHEAALIWAPYGVAIARHDSVRERDADAIILTVSTADHGRSSGAPARDSAFGAIRFDDGVPERAITLFYNDILRLLTSTSITGWSEPQWPIGLRERALGRVVGRVIAHEIGHFLLRWPSHGPTGLMRAQHLMPDFVGVARAPFFLSKVDQARWLAVTTAARGAAAVEK